MVEIHCCCNPVKVKSLHLSHTTERFWRPRAIRGSCSDLVVIWLVKEPTNRRFAMQNWLRRGAVSGGVVKVESNCKREVAMVNVPTLPGAIGVRRTETPT